MAARLIGIAATMVLARLLTPADYGRMAYVGVILSFIAIFQDMGITQTLISWKEDPGSRIHAAFMMSLLSGVAFYGLIAALAWPVSRFAGEPELAFIFLAMGLVVTLQTAGQVHYALLVRSESYRWLFGVAVMQAVVFLLVAVGLALNGRGVWSLVWGHLASHAVRTASLWARSGWRPWSAPGPRPTYDRALFRSGGGLAAANLLDAGADGFLLLSLGRSVGSRELGIYRVSFEASRLSYFGLPALAGSVGLTGYAALLEDPAELKRVLLKGLRIVNSLAMPAAAILAALAPWLVPVLWGEQWHDAIPVFGLLALFGMTAPTANIVRPYFIASRQIRLYLKLILFRAGLFLVAVPLAVSFGSEGTALAHVALITASSAVMLSVALRRIGLGAGGLGAAILWPMARALAGGVAAASVARLLDGWTPLAVLPPAALAGGLVYLLALAATSRDSFRELADVIRRGVAPGPR